MVNKRGWMRVLEVTIAILLISGVLLFAYSKQIKPSHDDEYIFNVQNKILRDISIRDDLRKAVLGVLSDEEYEDATNGEKQLSEGNFSILDGFVLSQMPSSYSYVVRVCDLGSVCSLGSTQSIENFREDVDVFAEDIIISAVVSDKVYDPKKVVLFVWEEGRQ